MAARRDELVRALMDRAERGAKLGLERVQDALELLGRPDHGLTIAHVAGTNGKGSTCAMLEAIGSRAGLITGLYTSPHLHRLNERIRIAGEPIADDALAEVLSQALDPSLPRLSFFEVLTVASLLAMARAGVDLAILEVGLGGRLDATNAVSPAACGITSIGLDHARYLGDSLAAVAGEKAGILERGRPAVIGALPQAALDTVLERARAVGAEPLWVLDPEGRAPRAPGVELFGWDESEAGAELTLPSGPQIALRPALLGRHQRFNAAIAAGLAWHLLKGESRAPEIIADGIAKASWPGRLERMTHEGVNLLFDCAHNLEAVDTLCRALDDLGLPEPLLLFGAMEDKPWRAMLERLAPRCPERIYSEPLERLVGRGPASLDELNALAPGRRIASPEEAAREALALAKPGQVVLVTGSIFLVGAVRGALSAQPRDVVVPL